MRRIAIIGSGQAGLLAAHALLKANYHVTLFSDRTADHWLNESRAGGAAVRFDSSLAFERELELNHWDNEAPKGLGVNLTVCPEIGNRLLTLSGRAQKPFMAIDLRLQSSRWMDDFEARGGKLVIEKVSVSRLDQIAAEHELTIVATGQAELSEIFSRDASRSAYDKPQRNLAMVIARGLPMSIPGVPFLPVKYNLFATAGEAFWAPYYHKDVGPSWNFLFEAKAGGPFDIFQQAKSGREVLELAKQLLRRFMPWEWEWAKHMELADDLGWLVGRVTPTVRKAVGHLPSGRAVMSLGDACMLLDPVGGQGANNGNKMAKNLIECIFVHEGKPFDSAWMNETFERYYENQGKYINRFSNILLEDVTPACQELLIAQFGSTGIGDSSQQAIADAFIQNFDDPSYLTPMLEDLGLARDFITKTTGHSWIRAGISGRTAVAYNQIRQKFKLPQKSFA